MGKGFVINLNITEEEKTTMLKKAEKYGFHTLASYIRFASLNFGMKYLYFESEKLKGGKKNG